MSDVRDRIGQTIHQLRRASRERGDIFLFFLEGKFYYVTEHPPAHNQRFILHTGRAKVKGKSRTVPVGGTLKCFKDLYEKFPDRFIGCYSHKCKHNHVREDIEEFFNGRPELS